ncbi:MAG: hypothetical protein AAGI28_15050 [Pseudomonadota bacterium]
MRLGQRQQGLPLRLSSALPLFIPAAAGVAYLGFFGAPFSYVIINAASLGAGLALIALLPFSGSRALRLAIAALLICLLAAPPLVGQSVVGVARWISVGGLTLHVGFVAAPLLVRIVATEPGLGPWIALLAMLAAFTQPDFATCLALAFGVFALAICHKNGAMGAVFCLGLAASIGASFAANPPPQPFVERILPELWLVSPWAVCGLILALMGGAVTLLITGVVKAPTRWALLATMAGFFAAAGLGDYPYPLIGYGASSVLGLALALLAPADDNGR